jgi:hypothetical protein
MTELFLIAHKVRGELLMPRASGRHQDPVGPAKQDAEEW